MYSSMTSASSCCHHRRPPQETQMTMTTTTTTKHDGKLSPGHLTKVLTNFSIDSIIGERPKQRLDHIEKATDDQSSALGIQKKFRPKNFACPVCRMAFSNNGQLKNHVRIHTGERPFQCNQTGCDKTFTRNEELTRHKLIHTGVRPHACPSCCKSFGRKDHLKKHVRTHERKRMRKRVYVPAAPSIVSKSSVVARDHHHPGKIIEPVYSSPPKRRVGSKAEGRLRSKVAIPDGSLSTTSSAQIQLSAEAPSLPLLTNGLPSIGDFEHFNASFMPLAPPVTLAQNFNHLIDSDSVARTMASLAMTNSLSLCRPPTSLASAASTGAALQQLAGDYWHKWYSFLGLCHHQQQQHTIPSSKRI